VGHLPQTATIPSLVCSREMLPVAFLDPSAFVGTNPTGELITVAARSGSRWRLTLCGGPEETWFNSLRKKWQGNRISNERCTGKADKK
jgi:hypothetical protein